MSPTNRASPGNLLEENLILAMRATEMTLVSLVTLFLLGGNHKVN